MVAGMARCGWGRDAAVREQGGGVLRVTRSRLWDKTGLYVPICATVPLSWSRECRVSRVVASELWLPPSSRSGSAAAAAARGRTRAMPRALHSSRSGSPPLFVVRNPSDKPRLRGEVEGGG